MAADSRHGRGFQVLLVEDSGADVLLTREALADSPVPSELSVVRDGEQAMAFLRRQGQWVDAPRPDLVLLDLNLQRKDGREVLAEAKADADLCDIPIVILTTSTDRADVKSCYQAHANCYIVKPVDFMKFRDLIGAIQSFWFAIARLPDNPANVAPER